MRSVRARHPRRASGVVVGEYALWMQRTGEARPHYVRKATYVQYQDGMTVKFIDRIRSKKEAIRQADFQRRKDPAALRYDPRPGERVDVLDLGRGRRP